MHSKKAKGLSIVLNFVILLICLSAIGVSYAAWADDLTIASDLKTGAMDLSFDGNNLYEAKIVSVHNSDQFSVIKNCQIEDLVVDTANKTLAFAIGSDILLKELAKPNRQLMLQYPIYHTEKNTIENYQLFRPGIAENESERLELTLLSSYVLLNNHKVALPEAFNDLIPKVECYVERKLFINGDNSTEAVFLELTPASLSRLEAPLDLSDAAGLIPTQLESYIKETYVGETNPILLDLVQEYQFTIPLYFIQK